MGNPLTTQFSNINVNCDISKEDLVAIAVSKHEQALIQQKELLEKEVIEIEETRAALTKARDKHILTIVQSRFNQPLKALLLNLKAIGFQSATTNLEAALQEVKDKHVINASIHIFQENTNSYSRASMSRIEQIDLDDKTNEFIEQLQILTDKLERTRIEAVKIRKDLSKISTMERQARATLAMNVLQQSDKGKQLLANLDIQKTLTSGN